MSTLNDCLRSPAVSLRLCAAAAADHNDDLRSVVALHSTCKTIRLNAEFSRTLALAFYCTVVRQRAQRKPVDLTTLFAAPTPSAIPHFHFEHLWTRDQGEVEDIHVDLPQSEVTLKSISEFTLDSTTVWLLEDAAPSTWREERLLLPPDALVEIVGYHGMRLRLDDFERLAFRRTPSHMRPLYASYDFTRDEALQVRFPTPPCFHPEQDVLAKLRRPIAPSAWLVHGGPRSGTAWHIDPNASSAFNHLLFGVKLWFVAVKRPESAVVDLAPHELLARRDRLVSSVDIAVFTQRAGETVFVPTTVWHAVVNLTWTACVTRNFCHNADALRAALASERRLDDLALLDELEL